MDMTIEEYINYVNHLFVQRMDDANYLAAMLQSTLGEL
jgi:hypothetical protein